MKTLALAAALLASTAVPALAANTALAIFTDGSDITIDSGAGFASIGPENLDGVTISLSFAARGTSPVNQLSEGNINIDNTTTTTQTLHILAGANGFLGPDGKFALSSTVINTGGTSDFSGSFFVDQNNVLNGLDTFPTGVDIANFDSGSLGVPQSFSFNGVGFDNVTTPYGMSEVLTLSLSPGASVAVQGISMEASAVPEPSTWAMLAIGFGFMAWGALTRKKIRSFA